MKLHEKTTDFKLFRIVVFLYEKLTFYFCPFSVP